MSRVTNDCKSYFQGFQNTYKCSPEKKKITHFVGFLKVLSYFTAVIPLIFGVVYAFSLCGRGKHKKILSAQEKKIDTTAQAQFPETRAFLEQRRKRKQTQRAERPQKINSSKIRQILRFDPDYRVGIILNPTNNILIVNNMGIGPFSAIVISDKYIPPEIMAKVYQALDGVRPGLVLTTPMYNGLPIFKAFGFK